MPTDDPRPVPPSRPLTDASEPDKPESRGQLGARPEQETEPEPDYSRYEQL